MGVANIDGRVGILRDGRVRGLIKCTNKIKEGVVESEHSMTIYHDQSITHQSTAAIKNFGNKASMFCIPPIFQRNKA